MTWDFVRRHSLTLVFVTILVVQTAVYLWAIQPQLPKANVARYVVGEYFLSILADTYGGLLLIWATKKFNEQGSPESGDE